MTGDAAFRGESNELFMSSRELSYANDLSISQDLPQKWCSLSEMNLMNWGTPIKHYAVKGDS